MDQSNSYFTISDLAKELDVKKSHIRFCEENGLIPPRASKLKRRAYNRYDRERLKLVFHFVLLGYSKEQIIDLIGIPDANLGENDQLMQGIEYGLKELKILEKRREELSFTKQTRTINEIEMLREYIKKIKIIKSGVLEEPSERPSIRFEDKAKIPTRPVTAITAEAEKKTTKHPVKVISLFVAGLALVIFIGSYFYYQAGQKETKIITLAQKKPIHSEKILTPQMPEPVDQTAKAPVLTPEQQKIPDSTSPAQLESVNAQSTDASFDVTKRNEEMQLESDTNLLKDKKPVEKQALISPEIEEAPKDDVPKEVAGEDLLEKAATTAMGENTLTAAAPEAVKEKASDIEVKEAPESESAVKASPITDDGSLAPEKETFDNPKVEETPKDDVNQEVDSERVKEKAVPADEKMLTAAVSEPGVEKVPEADVKPSLPESEKKMEPITSEVDINQQKNELNRLKSFLNDYCQAYTNKDLDKFISFFTLDATENNRPFHELLPGYRKDMEGKESLTYRIELMSFSKQTTSKNLIIRGRFFTRYQSQKGVWKENNGRIFMELLENGDSFLVKQLNY
jgi:DNA-binding transcriptional MerR regulator